MQKFVFVLFAAAALCASAQNQGFTVKPVRYIYRYTSVVLLEDKPYHSYLGSGDEKNTIGCEITYGITGDNMVSIDTKAIKVTSIFSGSGKDMLEDKEGWGHTSWKCDGRASWSDKRGEFAIFVTTPFSFIMADPQDKLILKGTVPVRTATKFETETLTFKTSEIGKEQKIGPLAFFIADPNKMWRGHDDKIGICVNGDENLIKEMMVIVGNRKIESNYTTNTKDNPIVRLFDVVPIPPEITLSVTYYTDMKEVVVPFGQEELEAEEKF